MTPVVPAPPATPVRSRARTAWIAVGAIVLFLACGLVSFPVLGALSGFPYRLEVTFLSLIAAWVVFIGIFVAGLRIAPRSVVGRPRAAPPAIAVLLISAAAVGAMWVIPLLAAW